jgi:type I restriction enzyme S subunit
VEIPLPPLAEQKRIAAILDKADALRRKRREAIAKLDVLLQSVFLDMFGDPDSITRRWPVTSFAQVLTMPLRNGQSPSKSGGVRGRVLTLTAITRGSYDESAVKEALFDSTLPGDKLVDSRDFLICRGNGNPAMVGRGAYPTYSLNDTAFPDTMIAARVDTGCVLPAFIEMLWCMPLVRKQMVQAARTTNGTYKVNQGGLEATRIILPPVELQRTYQERTRTIQQLATRFRAAGMACDRLFERLQSDAFPAPE